MPRDRSAANAVVVPCANCYLRHRSSSRVPGGPRRMLDQRGHQELPRVRLTLDPIRDRLNPNRRKKAQAQTSQAEPTQPPEPTYHLPARPPEPIRIQDPAKAPKGPVADATKVVTEVTRNKYVALVL